MRQEGTFMPRIIPTLALGIALACGSGSQPSVEQVDEGHLRGLVAAPDSAWQAKDSARVATIGSHLQ
jgi:hypothetical protein